MTMITREHSTSLAEAAHYPHIAWIQDLESQYDDPDPTPPQILINSFLYDCRAILKISSKSAHNL